MKSKQKLFDCLKQNLLSPKISMHLSFNLYHWDINSIDECWLHVLRQMKQHQFHGSLNLKKAPNVSLVVIFYEFKNKKVFLFKTFKINGKTIRLIEIRFCEILRYLNKWNIAILVCLFVLFFCIQHFGWSIPYFYSLHLYLYNVYRIHEHKTFI